MESFNGPVWGNLVGIAINRVLLPWHRRVWALPCDSSSSVHELRVSSQTAAVVAVVVAVPAGRGSGRSIGRAAVSSGPVNALSECRCSFVADDGERW